MKTCAKTLLSLLLCGFVAGVACADWLCESQVRAAAEAFPARDAVGASVLQGRTLRELAPRDGLWIARYDPSGYAVFSGSDLVGPVVAFSGNDYVEPSEGEAFYDILKGASGGCRAAEAAGETPDGLIRRAKWQKLLVTTKVKALLKGSPTSGTNVTSVEPFMKTHWNQCQPFNDFAPVYDAAASSDTLRTYRGRCPCGCIATAAAQVFRYWNWPARIDTVRSCNHKFVDSASNVTNDYTVRFDGHVPIDWGKIADVYSNRGTNGSDMRGTLQESERYHVARLVQMCGLLGNMVFEPEASSSSFDTLMPNAPWYTGGTKYSLGSTSGEDYERAVAALKADIVARRPVMVSMPSQNHAVVAHGWMEDADTRYVYLNFGWGESSSDAYYSLDDSTSEYPVEDIYVGVMPKMMAQLDPLPAVSPETVRLSWHIPEVWANSGSITGCQVVAYATSDNLADWSDGFSSAKGETTSSLLGVNSASDADSASGALCAWPLASGTYTWAEKMLLTSRSVLTYSLKSEFTLGHTLTVEAKFDDGEWTVVSAPSLNERSSSLDRSLEWKTVRVFLGAHGGEMAQFRVKVSFPGDSYYQYSDPIISIDNFKVTEVFAQAVTRRRCAVDDLSATIDGCRGGSRCSFAVELSSADGAVVTSEPVSTMIKGTAMMPRPGNEGHTVKNLVFATVGAEDVWTYDGNVTSSNNGVADYFYIYEGYICSVSAQIHGKLTEDSLLSFGFRSTNYYTDGSYDTITTTFTDESGNSTVVETLTRSKQYAKTELNSVSLGRFAGQSGTVTVKLLHTPKSRVREGTCVIEGVQVLNVAVPELPDQSYTEEPFCAAEMPAINNVAHSKSAVADGMFAECSMGGNIFHVECTPGVVALEAHVSAASYIPDSAIAVRNRGNGKFDVEMDASGIPATAERTRAIMTLAATDANGSTAYKDVSLRFSSETAKTDFPFAPGDFIVDGYSGEYDGAAHWVVVRSEIRGFAVKYAAAPDGEFAADSPTLTDVGSMTVWYEISAPGYMTQTNSATVTVTRAENAWIAEPSLAGWECGLQPNEPDMGEAIFGEVAVTYGATGSSRPTAAGNYVATFTVEGTPNYSGLTNEVPFAIKPSRGEKLQGIFGSSADVEPDGDGGWIVTLADDMPADRLPIDISDNMGNVTIDLNGHDLIGPDGDSLETVLTGGPTIRIVPGDGEGEPTQLTIVTTGDNAAVRGGKGAPAIEVSDGANEGVLVNIGAGVTVQGGGDDMAAIVGDVGENEGTIVKPTRFHIPGSGTVSAPKTWKAGQKATWKATAAKGSVFAHWAGAFTNSIGLSRNELRNPSLAFVVPAGFDESQISAVFIAVDDDRLSNLAITKTEFDLKVAVDGVRVVDDSESYVTASASGLPAGLKFDAKTLAITGAPTKSGVFWVQIKAKNASGYQWAENVKVTVSGGGTEAKVPKLTRTAYYPVTVVCATDGGTATGTGVYADAKKVSISAKPAKGYVFAGWYRDAELSEPMAFASADWRTASQSVVVPEARYLFARFVLEAYDIDSLKVAVSDVSTAKDGALELDLGACAESLSLPKIAVTGLPAGLKLDAKTLKIAGKATKPGVYAVKVSATNASVKKATPASTATFTITVPNFECGALPGLDPATNAYGTVWAGVAIDPGRINCTPKGDWSIKVAGLPAGLKFDVKTGKITGVPTAKDGSYTVTFTASKKGEANQVATITLNVKALPAWAVGNFDGGFNVGQASLTIAAGGKISGKILTNGQTWTLSASAFDSVQRVENGESGQNAGSTSSDVDDLAFIATVTGKATKDAKYELVVTKPEADTKPEAGGTIRRSGAGGNAVLYDADGKEVAWLGQTNWNAEPWKKVGKALPKEYPYHVDADSFGYDGEITLKFAASGKVTTKGVFAMGIDSRTGNPITYSASGSAVLIPMTLPSATGAFASKIYVYLPPKTGKFPGYCGVLGFGQ